MPFAITCPACQHVFRSKTEREIGKGVQCAKCANQFYVTAENQEEVRESKNAPPPTPNPTARNRRQSRDRVDEDDPEVRTPRKAKAMPRKKGVGKILLLVGLLGFVMLATAIGGTYFLFFRGPTAENRVQPKRPLPMEMFVYCPTKQHNINYKNIAELRKNGHLIPNTSKYFLDKLPKNMGVNFDQVDAFCECRAGFSQPGPTVIVVRFSVDCRIEDFSQRLGLKSQTVNAKTIYQGKPDGNPIAMFQPTAKDLVLIKPAIGGSLETKFVEELPGRTSQNFELLPETIECLQEASGYPDIRLLCGSGELGVKASVSGYMTNSQKLTEHYDFRVFDSAASAKAQEQQAKKILLPHMKEKTSWVKGERYYVFSIENLRDD